MMKYLAIDTEVKFAESEAMVWRREVGVDMERVDNMTEGIKKLQTGNYLYVGINSDVVEYAPLLQTMKYMSTPIFIATSERNYSVKKQSFAMTNGADLYGLFQKNALGNIDCLMAQLKYLKLQKQSISEDILICLDVIATETTAFVRNYEINLMPLDFKVLRFLMQNSGYTVSPEKILHMVWGHNIMTVDAFDLVRGAISRIRQKLAAVSETEYIITEPKKGYKMLS